MEKLNITQLAKAGGARLFGNADTVIERVVIDSRECTENTLFVCIIGDVNDGHRFTENAYELGCKAFLMSDAYAASEMLQKHDDISVVLTQDTQECFRKMAEWYIDFIGVKRIGVTGSVGKTTTKTLTAAVLAKKYSVVSSQKNYNTQLGLCMTSFLADLGTDIIVYEMGMDRKGEIDSYCKWVKPETGIITVIGDSHLERLGSKGNIAKAKFEITNYFKEDDVLIYNSDSPFMDIYSLGRLTKGNYVPIPVGTRDDASVKILNIEDRGLGGIRFGLQLKTESITITLPLLGVHNAINAALAATCGILYNIEVRDIIDALAKVSGADRRLAFEDVNGLLLLDDSYNANPASMCAAIDVLMRIKADRHVAILSDMYELGSDEISGHMIVGSKVGESGVDMLIAVGKKAELMAQMAGEKNSDIKIVCFEKTEESLEKIIELVGPGDAVLVKGSNATKIGSVAAMLRSLKN